MADNDKKPMSRLMKLANKFNCFYLSGKRTRRAAPASPRIIRGDASPDRVIDGKRRGRRSRGPPRISISRRVFAIRVSEENNREEKKKNENPEAYRGRNYRRASPPRPPLTFHRR